MKGFYIKFKNLFTNKEREITFNDLNDLRKEFYKYVGREKKYLNGKRIAVIKVDRIDWSDDFVQCNVEYFPFDEMNKIFSKEIYPILSKMTEYINKLNKETSKSDNSNKYKSIIKNYEKIIFSKREKFIKKYTFYYYQLLCEENNVYVY